MFVLRNALHIQNQSLQRRIGPFVNAVALFDLLVSFLGFSFEVRLLPRRLQTVRIFAYSSTREQSNKRSGTRLKTESKTGERR